MHCLNSDLFDECSVCLNKYSIEEIAQLITPSLSASAATALAFLVSNYPVQVLQSMENECRQLVASAEGGILKLLPILYIFGNFDEIDQSHLQAIRLTYDSVRQILEYDSDALLGRYQHLGQKQKQFVLRCLLQFK